MWSDAIHIKGIAGLHSPQIGHRDHRCGEAAGLIPEPFLQVISLTRLKVCDASARDGCCIVKRIPVAIFAAMGIRATTPRSPSTKMPIETMTSRMESPSRFEECFAVVRKGISRIFQRLPLATPERTRSRASPRFGAPLPRFSAVKIEPVGY